MNNYVPEMLSIDALEGVTITDDENRFIETIALSDTTLSQQVVSLKTDDTESVAGAVAIADTSIKVLKFAWDFIKESTAVASTEFTSSQVLAEADKNWQHYANAKDFKTNNITWKLDNVAGVNCFTTVFKVIGTYRAKHTNFGGMWIPNIEVVCSKCNTNWPWNVNGTVAISSSVSNKGSHNDPIPQVNLAVKLNAQAPPWESKERTFNFVINAQSGIRLL